MDEDGCPECEKIIIAGADPVSFVNLGDRFVKDNNFVYFRGERFTTDYELIGYIDIVHRVCAEDCMGAPFDIEYVFFRVVDAENKDFIASLMNTGNSFVRGKELGLGCLDRKKMSISSWNEGDDGAVTNLIADKDFEKLLKSDKDNPIRLKVSSAVYSGGRGVDNCYSHYRDFKVLD